MGDGIAAAIVTEHFPRDGGPRDINYRVMHCDTLTREGEEGIIGGMGFDKGIDKAGKDTQPNREWQF